jgi:hypothetical protein
MVTVAIAGGSDSSPGANFFFWNIAFQGGQYPCAVGTLNSISTHALLIQASEK